MFNLVLIYMVLQLCCNLCTFFLIFSTFVSIYGLNNFTSEITKKSFSVIEQQPVGEYVKGRITTNVDLSCNLFEVLNSIVLL